MQNLNYYKKSIEIKNSEEDTGSFDALSDANRYGGESLQRQDF